MAAPMENEELTQLTQGMLDPRRLGRNNSGLTGTDIADVICILHPCSPAAFRLVASTAQRSSRFVLQRNTLTVPTAIPSQSFLEEQETFIIGPEGPLHAMDLAFRFSTLPLSPRTGYVFGRHETYCDIVLSNDAHKRVSNVHFAIFINESGILMLQDFSTNGTMVDDVLLRGKTSKNAQTRMLNHSSIIQILSPQQDEVLKFIVRLPSRDGFYDEYEARFQDYRQRIAQHQQDANTNDAMTRRLNPVLPANTGVTRSVRNTALSNQFGMHWGGGDRFNVIGLIGKGAFASVYQLATKAEGKFFAAKELEKRKFMKNGVLDHKLDNEMKIMKDISHPNIVKYVDYHDHTNHLYIIMEYVPYGDLQGYLPTKGPLSEDLGKTMSAQVLDSLAYLHAKRITHRDIKPDNILLADDTPENFTIKLSDFGLSKVVTDNETFLKTFCGTLLYCAPEVFPHYDAHIAGRGQKRTRRSAMQAQKFHSYSQSVDIWSYGAVLWFSLCLKPPFEGVADTTGRGMFDRIMMTPLNPADLVGKGISDVAVSLLFDMLNTDPASRPSPAECLNHPWLSGSARHNATALATTNTGLVAIAEEDAEHEKENDPTASAEQGILHQGDSYEYDDEVSVHSDSFNFFDPRQSKRFKSGVYAYRSRDGDLIDSSPELMQTGNSGSRPSDPGQPVTQPAHPKLFGEISESQFALLNIQRDQADATSGDRADIPGNPQHGVSIKDWTERQHGDADLASPSLLGAESLLRDVHMGSPGRSNSPSSADPHSFDLPKTPANGSLEGSLGKHVSQVSEVTPRAPQPAVFDRTINLPVRASFFYDPSNPMTHNPEYATLVTGHDFKKHPTMTLNDKQVELARLSGSLTEDDFDTHNEKSGDETEDHIIPVQTEEETAPFVKPPPRLGRLISTDDSFSSITINLTTRTTTWGRLPSNTHVYPDANDTRIAKRGIIVHFDSSQLSSGDCTTDLAKLGDLQAHILTESRSGLKINGVHIETSTEDKKRYGMLYTNDEITVIQPSPRNNFETLKFRCEFYHGESKQERPLHKRGFQTELTTGGDANKTVFKQTGVAENR